MIGMVQQAQKPPETDLTAFGQERPSLALIDLAVEAVREAGHGCRNQAARECVECALALLRESRMAESGRESLGAERVVSDVMRGLRVMAALFEGERGR
jgi:hypothetical protein